MDRKVATLLALFFISSWAWAQKQAFRLPFKAMGSAFEVVVVAPKDSLDWAQEMLFMAEKEIRRIENLISSWDPNSETSSLNAAAGGAPLTIDPELNDLIWRSVGLHQISKGAFDITYASMADLWNFAPEKRNEWPDSARVDSMRQFVDVMNVEFFFDDKISITKKGTRIGFGGVGKGYAADKTAKLLQKLGVKNGVINASGDLYCWGKDANNQPWKVAVVDPKDKNVVKMWLAADNQAIVTSGDYEKYKMKDGVRYAHIINPQTGYPVSGIMSATVIAPKAELADALATSIFVLGVQQGLALINSLERVECVIIDNNDKLWYSTQIKPQHD